MRQAIEQIVNALDKAKRLRVVSIHYDGERVSFTLAGGDGPGADSAPDDVEAWLKENGAQ